jgi:two-component system response regulator CssR
MLGVKALARKIYIVEDEKSLNMLLEKYLEREGYEVATFFDGRSAMERIKDMPDLWILDIMLPDTDGYEIIKAIKKNNKSTPVIFMSARNEELDRVVGLELGSDDYLSKPFLPRELVIRTNKLIERIYGKENEKAESMDINFDGYIISKNQRTVVKDGEELQLTNKEFDLLVFLASNPNRVFNKEELFDRIWGMDSIGDIATVTVHIRKLREKIETDPSNPQYIETIWGAGYRFEA